MVFRTVVKIYPRGGPHGVGHDARRDACDGLKDIQQISWECTIVMAMMAKAMPHLLGYLLNLGVIFKFI